MSVFLQPIYTQTVGATSVGSVTFNNIPQTFTDLKLVISARNNNSAGFGVGLFMQLNGTSTAYSYTGIYGDGSSAGTSRFANTTEMLAGESGQSNLTANTFGNTEIYIPNYTSTNFKQVISDGVGENNGTTSLLRLYASLWQNTAAVTSLRVFYSSILFTQYSTFTLYGITKG